MERLDAEDIEDHRKQEGLEAISSACFGAARISALLIDDGIQFDKMHPIEWHKTCAPFVGRILRIERLAEHIINEAILHGLRYPLDKFTKAFVYKLKLAAPSIVVLKSIAAYRSGLEINIKGGKKEAEVGLDDIFKAGTPVRLNNKSLIDYIYLQFGSCCAI